MTVRNFISCSASRARDLGNQEPFVCGSKFLRADNVRRKLVKPEKEIRQMSAEICC